MAKVIHIKDSTKSEDEIYIGRPGKGHLGPFGNPVKINSNCFMCGQIHKATGDTLKCYEEWLQIKLSNDKDFAKDVADLKDKTLVCFCKPKACHGDILKKYAEEGL